MQRRCQRNRGPRWQWRDGYGGIINHVLPTRIIPIHRIIPRIAEQIDIAAGDLSRFNTPRHCCIGKPQWIGTDKLPCGGVIPAMPYILQAKRLLELKSLLPLPGESWILRAVVASLAGNIFFIYRDHGTSSTCTNGIIPRSGDFANSYFHLPGPRESLIGRWAQFTATVARRQIVSPCGPACGSLERSKNSRHGGQWAKQYRRNRRRC